jgi:hypothetical protein
MIFLLHLWAATTALSEPALRCDLRFVNQQMCAQLDWKVPPHLQMPFSEFELYFFDALTSMAKDPVGRLDVVADMHLTMPEMDSIPVCISQDQDKKPLISNSAQSGHFMVSHIYFSMSGLWVLTFTLNAGGQVVDRAEVRFQIP